mmetsp:Transcript_15690/g.52865  ORF Transcript_15690/g.52865 Transcript_15690/m.52865 type:complete len:267 (-) Transcript_15690:708-1508(-)
MPTISTSRSSKNASISRRTPSSRASRRPSSRLFAVPGGGGGGGNSSEIVRRASSGWAPGGWAPIRAPRGCAPRCSRGDADLGRSASETLRGLQNWSWSTSGVDGSGDDMGCSSKGTSEAPSSNARSRARERRPGRRGTRKGDSWCVAGAAWPDTADRRRRTCGTNILMSADGRRECRCVGTGDVRPRRFCGEFVLGVVAAKLGLGGSVSGGAANPAHVRRPSRAIQVVPGTRGEAASRRWTTSCGRAMRSMPPVASLGLLSVSLCA